MSLTKVKIPKVNESEIKNYVRDNEWLASVNVK